MGFKPTLPPPQAEYEKCYVVSGLFVDRDGNPWVKGPKYLEVICKTCPPEDAQVQISPYDGNFIARGGSRCQSCANGENSTRHGMYGTRTYERFYNMWDRVKNDKYYLENGIEVEDPDWDTFPGFLQDMGGIQEDKRSLERIDNSRGYGKVLMPDGTRKLNCVWADDIEQANNRYTNLTIEVKQVSLTVAEAARQYGVGYTSLLRRIHTGESGDEAIKFLLEFQAKDPLTAIAKGAGVSYAKLWNRVNAGMSVEQALEDMKRPTVKQVADQEGLDYNGLLKRMNHQGMTLEEAVADMKKPSLKELARQHGVCYQSLWRRVKRGQTVDFAIAAMKTTRTAS